MPDFFFTSINYKLQITDCFYMSSNNETSVQIDPDPTFLTNVTSFKTKIKNTKYAAASLSTFGNSDPAWKFQETYNTAPGSNFGSYVPAFGVPCPGWTFDSK